MFQWDAKPYFSDGESGRPAAGRCPGVLVNAATARRCRLWAASVLLAELLQKEDGSFTKKQQKQVIEILDLLEPKLEESKA